MQKFAGLLALLVILFGCGKKGSLIYPELTAPAAPSAVTVRQAGQALRLSFVLPGKDQAGRGVAELGGVTILKRAAAMGQDPACPACTEGFVLFKKLYLELPPAEMGAQRFGSRLLLLDGDVRVGGEYSYTVAAFTKDAQDGLASPPATAGMVAPPLPPELKAESLPTEIRLSFAGAPPPQGVLVGYNLYRAPQGDPLPFLPLNREPIAGTGFVDIGLDRNLGYNYAARTVVHMPNGVLVESELSNQVGARLTNE